MITSGFQWFPMVSSGSHAGFLMVHIGSKWFLVVPSGSHELPVVLNGCQWLPVVLNGYQWVSCSGSHELPVVLNGCQWFPVILNGYHGVALMQWFSMVVSGWFPVVLNGYLNNMKAARSSLPFPRNFSHMWQDDCKENLKCLSHDKPGALINLYV